MISRSRSAPTAAAMSIECTTSANSTVTCLYSAGVVAVATAAPHSLQNFEFGGSSVPHDPHKGSPPSCHAASPPSFTVNIVSPLANNVLDIAVPSPRRSFELKVYSETV